MLLERLKRGQRLSPRLPFRELAIIAHLRHFSRSTTALALGTERASRREIQPGG
jgi:hypothetical protein